MEIKERYATDSETTSLWDDYQNGLAYQSSVGLSKKIPMFVKFYEGDQWAAPTKNTKNTRPIWTSLWNTAHFRSGSSIRGNR